MHLVVKKILDFFIVLDNIIYLLDTYLKMLDIQISFIILELICK